ncbi:hypothetical protein FXV77_14780 [Sphingobacterium phlebotomi]|uniref:Uncharacterized protein n=1 Tax=Sphingobacterium phlebotomi TaxID=2605433 RepID=A0A5D4H375_9SPHI|nr:hypothetical protein [Sphingobacterium phlebotomi]TYR34732.1 hypothetical protein FXV77_14780 [Sphingobacterium phlebotomi]
MDKDKPISLVERLKRIALEQKRESVAVKPADSLIVQCPQCGAGRAKRDGLTKCAYCGYEFIATQLSDGIIMKEEDNSK